jgi:CheY-like chemotaxis protein
MDVIKSMLRKITGKKHALVVDDEDPWRYVLRTALESKSWSVTEAESGETCLQLIRREHYDVVFMDYKMPGMNGLQTLEQLRKVNAVIPVVFISGYAEVFNDETEKRLMPVVKLSKPMSWREIEHLVDSLT